jgi:glutathione S-transferase
MNLELYFAPGACSFVPHAGLEAIKAATGNHAEAGSCTRASSARPSADEPNDRVPVLVVDGVAHADRGDLRLPRPQPAGRPAPADPWSRSQTIHQLA